jgi:hypothetical protein
VKLHYFPIQLTFVIQWREIGSGWPLVDEPLINEPFESQDELEEVLATRCCVLQTMSQEIKNITNYYWFNSGLTGVDLLVF